MSDRAPLTQSHHQRQVEGGGQSQEVGGVVPYLRIGSHPAGVRCWGGLQNCGEFGVRKQGFTVSRCK